MRLGTLIRTHQFGSARNHLILSGLRRMSSRTYENAVENLNSLQSNAAVLAAHRATGGRAEQFAKPEMIEYLGRIGYAVRLPGGCSISY